MDYEKKYKETLKKIENLRGYSLECNNTIDELFPELREPDDEWIRKELIEYLNDVNPNSPLIQRWIAWLKKQGEQNSTPKFKIGDWVVFNNDHDSIYQVEKIENYEYTLRHILGGSMCLSFSHENMIRAWTIGDAKDGDVLVADDDKPFIFKGLLDPNHPNYPVAHCGLDSEDYLIVSHSNVWWTDECVKPATIEQRNLLFSKMKEKGYEWDANKKELRKIEHKLTWSDEDEKMMQCIHKYVKSSASNFDYENIQIWFRNIKNRVQPHWKPTVDQMQSLYFAVITYSKKDDYKLTYDSLNSLYNDLKKL